MLYVVLLQFSTKSKLLICVQETIARDFLAADIGDCQPRKLVDDLVTLASSTVDVS